MNRLLCWVAMMATTILISVTLAGAGPIAEFEAAFADVYAQYRIALFRTNQKDKAGSEAAIAAFNVGWQGLAGRWGQTPPAHYAEDPAWRDSLAAVTRVAEKAQGEAAGGDLPAAHETLEQIRDLVAELRERNNRVTFSDRMNAYHEKMEQVLGKAVRPLDTAAVAELREDAAVLSYLAAALRRYSRSSTKSDLTFDEQLKAVETSVGALAEAARKGDVVATKAALQKLKPAYGALFLKYG